MAIRFDEIELSSSGNAYYPVLSGVASAQYLKIQTSHGYLNLGANNSSYAHFYTDRGAYYFNTTVKFDGNIAGYDGDETAQFASFIDSNNTNYYVNPASGSVLGGTVTIHNDADSSVSIQNGGSNASVILAHAGDELYLGSNNQSTVRLHAGGMMELTTADTFYKYDGDKYARGFKNYQYYAGGGSYYGSGTHGWTKIATITITSNCSGANIFGKLYQRNYHDVAIINVALVIRGECDFTSNNESHFVENASTFAATSYHTDIDSSVRAVLTASSTNSRTYELQFYEHAWNDNHYELWTTGWSVLDTPAAPTASTGTARLNNNSYAAAKVYYGTASMRSPIFYDLNNTNYYCDPAGQNRLNSLNLGSSPTSGITGGYIAQIRGSMHMTNSSIDYVNQLHFHDNVRFQDDGNDSYLKYISGDTNTTGIKFYSNGGSSFRGYVYGDSDGIGFLDSDGNWSVRVPLGGSGLELRSNNNVEFTVNNDHTISHGSSRSPLFYDQNNTSYYIDPDTTGDAVKIKGSVRIDSTHSGGALFLYYQHSATDTANSGTLTGWVSEPGISYANAGIGANIHQSGPYYGRSINSGYGTYINFLKTNGEILFKNTTATAGNSGGQGTTRMTIGASGDVTASSSSRAPIFYDSNNTAYYVNPASSSVLGGASFGSSISITGTVTASSDVIAYSDERLKTNIETLDGSKVYEMRGVSFTKDEKNGSGVIAQELEKIAPELVNNDSEYKAVAYGNITGYLIEAIKDLKTEVEDLKKQLKDGSTK